MSSDQEQGDDENIPPPQAIAKTVTESSFKGK